MLHQPPDRGLAGPLAAGDEDDEADGGEAEEGRADREPGGDAAGFGEALAQQLNAVVQIAPGNPGTHVVITHTQIALVDDDEAAQDDAIVPAANVKGN